MADDNILCGDDNETGLEIYSLNALKYEIQARERKMRAENKRKEWGKQAKKDALKRTQKAIKDTEKRLAEADAVIDANEKKIEEGLTPIKIGDELVLKDVVDDILTSYTPAVKKAIYKYRNKNIQKYNDYSREYNKNRMKDPAYAEHKKMMNARSNEKARLKRLREREALQKKVVLVKCESIPVSEENIIIETNNGN